MKNLYLSLIVLMTSCSSTGIKQQEFHKKLTELEAQNKPKHESCINQEDNVLQKAISENPKTDIEPTYLFVQNENEALKYITAFDYAKTDHQSEDGYFKLYLTNCHDDLYKTYSQFHENKRMCSGVYREYHFIQGLIYGIAGHKWKPGTKAAGKKLVLNYLKNIAQEKSSLISLLLGLSNLSAMTRIGVLPAKMSGEVDKILGQAEGQRMELQSAVQLNPPGNCRDEKKIFEIETELARETGTKMEELLKQL